MTQYVLAIDEGTTNAKAATISNQRESVPAWDRKDAHPLAPMLGWMAPSTPGW